MSTTNTFKKFKRKMEALRSVGWCGWSFMMLSMLVALCVAVVIPNIAHAYPTEGYVLLKTNAAGTLGTPVDVSDAGWNTASCDVHVLNATETAYDTGASAVVIAIYGNQCRASMCNALELNKYSPSPMALYSMSVTELAAGIGAFSTVGMVVQRLQAKLVTLTGGTTPVIKVRCSGGRY